MTNNKKNSVNVFFEESFEGIKSDIRMTLTLLSFCLFLSLFIRFILGFSLSSIVFPILFFWILLYLSHSHFIHRKKTRKELCDFHFKNTIVDLLLLTVVIHYLGGVEWVGAIFYIATLAWTSNVLSKKQSLTLAFFAILFYSGLALLEYLEIISHAEPFGASPGFYRNPAYIVVQILVLAAVFFFIIQNYGNFSEAFREKQKKIIEAQKNIEEAKLILEIRVNARTKELKELTESLEGQVKERTKDLQAKMEDLERFNKIVIDRELKMIELKKEIERLRAESGKKEAKA